MTFVIKKSWWLKQKWHFCIVATNGKILASSEKYTNFGDMRDAIVRIKIDAPSAQIIDKFTKDKKDERT